MSVIDTVFKILSNDPQLISLLGKHDLAPDYPAIYDRWVVEDVPFPYVVVSWDFSRGSDNFSQVTATLFIDIFTGGTSTILAEKIATRLKELFVRNRYYMDDGTPFHTDYLRDGDIPEDVPNIVHWSTEFTVQYWNKDLINVVNNR